MFITSVCYKCDVEGAKIPSLKLTVVLSKTMLPWLDFTNNSKLGIKEILNNRGSYLSLKNQDHLKKVMANLIACKSSIDFIKDVYERVDKSAFCSSKHMF